MENEKMFTREDIVKIVILSPIVTAATFGAIWLAAALVNVFG
jgi:hypothetical protein